MSSFHSLEFKDRFGAMGDAAEAAFAELHDGGLVRFGLDRPPLNMSMLPSMIRHTPDFLTSSYFVECQGMGRDQILKVKIDKLAALDDWNLIHPVRFFVYDSHNKRTWQDWLDVLSEICTTCPIKQFHDGPSYYAIPAEKLFDDT